MPNLFRTSTPMGDWRSFDFTCDVSGGCESGELKMYNDTVGVIFEDADFGDTAVLVYHIEKVVLQKATGTGEAANPGDALYWSGTYGDPVTVNWTSGYYWIAVAVEPAGENDAEVIADLKGDKATVGAFGA